MTAPKKKKLVKTNLPVVTRPRGRPKGSSKYTEEIADEIIFRMGSMGHTVPGITRTDEEGRPRTGNSFPSYATIYQWADPNSPFHKPDFSKRFARAKLDQHRLWIEETIDIANTPEPGDEEVHEHSAKNGITIRRARKDMLHHRALKIDVRFKAAARLNPALWAERLQQPAPQNSDNADGVVQRIIVEGGLPDDELPAPSDDPPAPDGGND